MSLISKTMSCPTDALSVKMLSSTVTVETSCRPTTNPQWSWKVTVDRLVVNYIGKGVSILCEYVIAAYFAYCRIFPHVSAKCTYRIYFSHKLAFSTAIFKYYLCFCYLFLLGFVTSTIWLPTEWHHACVPTL